MERTKVLVLDFDNCIALNEQTREGSEEIKDSAWFDVFTEIGAAALAPVLENAKAKIAGGKGDRKDIVEQVLNSFSLGATKEEVSKRCDKFNGVVQENIKKIPISRAVYESLGRISAHLPIYLNTATPREPIMETLSALGLMPFFKGVYGRPGTKESNLRAIIAAESVLPSEVVMVDDQHKVSEIARGLGCRFIGIDTKRNALWRTEQQPFPVIMSLSELEKLI